MDSITHIVTGACIGEIFAGKKLGKKAMLWGAAAQTLPDVDVVTSWWMNVPDSLLAHRGFTHSLLFAFLSTIIISWLAEKWHRPHNISFGKWYLFIIIEIFTHLFLDVQTAYGTGLMEPFNHARYTLNTIFVADPFFTIIPLIISVILLIIRKTSQRRMLLANIGIVTCCLYLFYCWYHKYNIDKDTNTILVQKNITPVKYFTTPSPLNNWLWYVVVDDGKGFYCGYRSVFDKNNNIDFIYAPKNDSLLAEVSDHKEVTKLIRFSNGYYTFDKYNDTLVLNDLRFEQQGGWIDKNAPFVFFYYLQDKGNNDLVIQRGRFKDINKKVFSSLIDRIKGN